jgi:hypothetical protein
VNPRDNKKVLIVLCGGILVGLYLLVHNLFLGPLAETEGQIEKLETSVNEKEGQVLRIRKDLEKLRQWRALSLPGVENLPPPPPRTSRNPQQDREHAIFLAKDRYLSYLRDLLRRHKLVYDDPVERTSEGTRNLPQLAPNVPVYTPLVYGIHARGTWKQIVDLLVDLETAPLLQRVSKVNVKHSSGTSAKAPKEPLTVSLTVEALIVNGAAKRGDNLFTIGQAPAALDGTLMALHRLPSGLSQIPWDRLYATAVSPRGRDYSDMPRKNIFEGPPPPKPPETGPKTDKPPKPLETPDLITHAFLMDVTQFTEAGASPLATVFDRATDRSNKLRMWEGWNWIPLLKCGEGNTVVRGKVVRMNTSGVVFHVQLFAQDPAAEKANRRFQRPDAIYKLYKDDIVPLVEAKAIKVSEVSRTYKIPGPYWNSLIRDKVVEPRRTGFEFAFKHGLVRGRIVKRDEKRDGPWVLICLHEKYCSFETEEETLARPHAGYCFLRVGEKLAQALQTPLQEAEIKKLTLTASTAPAAP